MQSKNTVLRYGSVAITLHWLIAILIIANICLGLYFADLPHNDPNKFGLTQLHKSIGLTVLLLSLARLVWRLMNPVPPLPRGMSAPLRVLARGTHVLLYFLIIAIPLSGWALVSSSPLGLPTMYFGLFEWPHIPFIADLAMEQKKMLRENFALIHIVLAWSAIVLIPIHVAGALYHQFFRGDDVLRRMLPGTNVSDVP
ncbi:MAG TPA: cytochrome b [Rhizomicrobium sp.]|jgi:cytochrome b561